MEDDNNFLNFGEEPAEYIRKFEEMLDKNESYYFDSIDFEDIILYYQGFHNTDKAMLCINIAIQQHPKNIELLLKKSELELELGFLNDSLGTIDKALVLDPFNEDIYITKSVIYSQLQNPKGSIKNLKKAIQLASDRKDELYIELAYEYQNIEDYDSTIKCLHAALKINPKNESGLYELAFCYDILNQFDESIKFYTRFLDEEPYSHVAWYNLGNTFCKIGDFDQAVSAFDFALVIKDDLSSASFNKANALMNLGRYREAISSFKEAMNNEGAKALTYNYIAECYEKLEQFNKAEDFYSKSIEIDETLSDPWLGLGIIKDIKGETKEALHFIKKAIELNPESSSNWHVYAHALEKNEDFDEAKTSYQKVLDINPDITEAWLDYSALLSEEGEYKLAIETIQQALDLADNPEKIMYRFIAYLLANGNKKEALNQLEHALQLNYNEHKSLLEYFPEALNNIEIVNLIDMYKK